MTSDELRLFHLIDQRAARYRYGVRSISQDRGGTLYRVDLSSPDGRRDKILVVFRNAVEESIKRGMLADAISKNVEAELGSRNYGRS